MLIYEKNNKLNINFDPSKSIEGTPDIQIGENEIKLGDAEITSENVLPTPTNEDVGKVPTVREDGAYCLENIPSELPVATPEDAGKVVSVNEDGEYELAESGGGSAPFVVNFSGGFGEPVCDKTFTEIDTAASQKLPILSISELVKNVYTTIVGVVIGQTGGFVGYSFTFFNPNYNYSSSQVVIYTVKSDNSVLCNVKTLSFS